MTKCLADSSIRHTQRLLSLSCRPITWLEQLEEDHQLGPQDSFGLNLRTIATLILTCLCALLANAAGIGGGPIYLPLLMVSSQSVIKIHIKRQRYTRGIFSSEECMTDHDFIAAHLLDPSSCDLRIMTPN